MATPGLTWSHPQLPAAPTSKVTETGASTSLQDSPSNAALQQPPWVPALGWWVSLVSI